MTVLELIGSKSAVRKKWVSEPKDLLTFKKISYVWTQHLLTPPVLFSREMVL